MVRDLIGGKKTSADVVSITKKLDSLRTKFAPFLAANPLSTIEEVEKKRGKRQIEIVNPWGDSSVGIRIPDTPEPLAEAMNALVLPARLTAVWHSDTNDLEVIWTAFNLSASQEEINGRAFNFSFKKKAHVCQFKKSSDRLITLTANAYPRTTSDTNWRNIQSFSTYSRVKGDAPGLIGTPLSFWISGVKYKEDEVIELLSNLNFYISYYDEMSPVVQIFSPKSSEPKRIVKPRYIAGKFPEDIDAPNLDSNLIDFWLGAYQQSPLIRFVIYYRIIEYAAAHYMESKARSQITRILSNPVRGEKIDDVINNISELMTTAQLTDENKIRGILNATCDPKLLWRYISANMEVFSKDVTLDGRFKIGAMVDKDMSEQQFCLNGMNQFVLSASRIRHALSHGRDLETKGVITPTSRNIQHLLPWVHLIGTAAAEVVLYEGLTK